MSAAIDHAQRAARIVHQLEDRIVPTPTYVPPAWMVDLTEFLALADSLKSAGYPIGDVMQRIQAIDDAVNRIARSDNTRWLGDVDLMTLDPEDIAERVRQAGIDQAANAEIVRQLHGLRARLATDAAAHLRADSDRVIAQMRARFDPAIKVVQAAAKRGLTEHSDMTLLLEMGAPDVIAAYRALGPAVTELDRIAGLRNQLTAVAGVGPREYPMAAFITGITTEAELDGAQNIWTGQIETVQHNVGITGTHLASVRRKRLGGPWLALVCAGYRLRLNTGDEAQAVLNHAS